MKKLTLLLVAALLLILALPLRALDQCDSELNQCLADCASFGNPTVAGRSCTSACVWYFQRCEDTGGQYCGGWGTGSGCYEQN